jgi:hypothetical protein
MQNSSVTTAVHRHEVDVSADWADEAEALAQRVTSKLRQSTPSRPQPVVRDEYEPQTLVEKSPERKPSGRLPKR